eukprot:Nk52_evm11s2531 gene=Nk52_evmTU11s2531
MSDRGNSSPNGGLGEKEPLLQGQKRSVGTGGGSRLSTGRGGNTPGGRANSTPGGRSGSRAGGGSGTYSNEIQIGYNGYVDSELLEEPPTGCGCHPKYPGFRYIVLVFICFLSFGSYFCYDNPAALQKQIMHTMGLKTSEYTMLYSLYSWPNVFMCFCGGFLLDQVFGMNWGTIFFSVLVGSGQFIVCLGAYYNQFWMMCVGRFIFGCGGEVLAVAQNTHSVNWFKGKELNMVFGLGLSFSRLGSTLNMNIMGPVFNYLPGNDNEKLGSTLLLGVILAGASLFCAFVLMFMNKKAFAYKNKNGAEVKVGEKFSFRDCASFPLTFWFIVLVCVFYYVAVFPFIGVGLLFFETRFGLDPQEASAVNSITFVLSAICSPIVGFLVDRTGRNVMWILFGIVTTLCCHLAMGLTLINPWVPMIAMGLSYSTIACALWPCVALVVPENQLGSAYGIMQSIQNLGLALISMLAGAIVDWKGYVWLEMFFSGMVFLALLCTIMLAIADSRGSGFLNCSKEMLVKMHEDRMRSASDASQPPRSPSYSPGQRPRSPFEIRNRYMSRLGISLPTTYRLNPLSGRSVLH